MSLEQIDHGIGHQYGPPQEASEDGPNSPIESGTRSIALHQVKNMVTGLSHNEPRRRRQQALRRRQSSPAAGAIQELIEAAQVRERHMDLRHRGQLRGPTAAKHTHPRFTGSEGARSLDHSFGTDQLLAAAGLDRLPHAGQRMIGQQLQDPHEPPCAGHRAVVFFQLGTELGEAGRKLPVPVHRGMVKRAGLAAQGREVVERVEDQRIGLPRPACGRDDLASGHDHDSVHIALDRHHLKCERPRNAVPVTLESDGLILVHWGRGANHAGIETMLGKRGPRRLVLRRIASPITNGPKSD